MDDDPYHLAVDLNEVQICSVISATTQWYGLAIHLHLF